ncbi:MAG: hypothetical protein HKN16_00520 [Saprospiraceae bacterium]|nr:hypothetical protein [Saprospiraceae bacterium]
MWTYTTPAVRFESDENVIEERCYTINVGICKYSGGGMQIVPHADFQSGQLAYTVVKSFPKWRVIFDSPKLFSGKLKTHPYALMGTGKQIRAQSMDNESLIGEVDGEFIGKGPFTYGCMKSAIRVVVPKTK